MRPARQELSAFAKVLDTPAKPVLAILGGAKARCCEEDLRCTRGCAFVTTFHLYNRHQRANMHQVCCFVTRLL